MTTKSNFPPISDNQSNLILTHYDTVRDLKTVIANAKRVLQQYVLNESGVENAELASLNQILNEPARWATVGVCVRRSRRMDSRP